jgi:hypothetical protein
MRDDGVVLPQPPMLRGLDWAREKLEKAENIEIVDFEPYKHEFAWDLIVRLHFFHFASYCADYLLRPVLSLLRRWRRRSPTRTVKVQ